MGNLNKKLKTVRGTTDTSNLSSTRTDIVERLVDHLQSSSLSDDRRDTNAVDEHRYHHHHHHHQETLDIERSKNSSSSKLQLNNSNEVDLIDDCWSKIFSYLSLDDMMQVEKVSLKWRELSQQWFRKVQTLEFSHNIFLSNCIFESHGVLRFYENYYEHKIYQKAVTNGFDDLISILHLCGHHIKYYAVEFCFRKKDRDEKCKKFMLQSVPKLCENIIDVKIRRSEFCSRGFTPSTLEIMTTHWKKLEKIDFESLPQPIDENFYNLLRNNKQLKSLKLRIDHYPEGLVTDKFFNYLPTTIEEIELNLKSPVDKNDELLHFISASKNFTSLKSLKFSSFNYLSDAVVAAIAGITSLTHLSLFDICDYESRRTIDPIANLKGLKSLDLSMGGYTFLDLNHDFLEDSFINIVENCIQLEQLNLSYATWLTNKGMDAIARLKKLTCLKINAEHLTSGSIISSCGNLKVFGCNDWKINKDDAIKLLKRETNLRFVDFHRCRNLTKDILQAANEIANERQNNILCMTGCGIVPIDYVDTPYFKFFNYISSVPLEIFPEDIENYLRKSYSALSYN